MRLDQYLAKKRNGLTRAKAQRAIKLGFIRVNGAVASKPAYVLKDTDKVSITNRNIAKMPADYFKLHEIQNKTKLIRSTDRVLVLANKGYALAATELAKEVVKDIAPASWPSEIGSVDLILCDKKIASAHNVLGCLKRDGKVLLTVKSKPSAKELEKHQLAIEKLARLASGAGEFYVVLIRK